MNSAWLLAEFIGTFTLIFMGAGSICLNDMYPDSVGLLGIAAAHGLAIAVMISALGHLSGGKFNPAVTLGLLIGKKIKGTAAIGEMAAQLLGALAAAVCLKIIFPKGMDAQFGTPALGIGISPGVGIFAEALMTFLLVFTVYGIAVDPRGSFKALAGFGIGSVILCDILVGGGITGGAMNPARAFGPAFISGVWTHHYVYWIGPMIGGLAAGLLYSRLILKQTEQESLV